MTRARVALVMGACGLIALAGSCGDTPTPSAARTGSTNAFFTRYVERDGRVVRLDEGADTVSEGQAYALLLAVGANDRERFDRVWSWTRGHLQRDDGLFSWHWKSGKIQDPSPAADADVDIARALLQAGDRFGDSRFSDAGRRVANAVLDHETIAVGRGRALASGPWAVATRTINPSYLDACGFADLASRTGDQRWQGVRDSAIATLTALTADGLLPPDWATLDKNGRPTAVGAPDNPAGDPQYGLDAVRVVSRLADCDAGVRLAASLWPTLKNLPDQGAAIAYSLEGERVARATSPVGLIAASSAASAAGDTASARALLTRAKHLDRASPTYYGSAWLALHTQGPDEVALAMVLIAERHGDSPTTTGGPPSTVVSATTTPPTTAKPTPTTAKPPTPTTARPPRSTTTTAKKPTTTTTSRKRATTTTAPPGESTAPNGGPAPGASGQDKTKAPSRSTTTTTRRGGAAITTTPTTAVRPGSLSAPPQPVNELLPTAGRPVVIRHASPAQRAGAAVAGGGALVALLLGIVFGLRERAAVAQQLA